MLSENFYSRVLCFLSDTVVIAAFYGVFSRSQNDRPEVSRLSRGGLRQAASGAKDLHCERGSEADRHHLLGLAGRGETDKWIQICCR